jgi:hypothetical protein
MGALYTPGTMVLILAGSPPASTCRFTAASPCPPPHFPSAEVRLTRHQQGFKQFARPVFPWPVAARMERAALGLSLGFAPRRPEPDNARQGGDRSSSTDLELHAQLIYIDLQSGSSLNTCDLASHGDRGIVAITPARRNRGRSLFAARMLRTPPDPGADERRARTPPPRGAARVRLAMQAADPRRRPVRRFVRRNR